MGDGRCSRRAGRQVSSVTHTLTPPSGRVICEVTQSHLDGGGQKAPLPPAVKQTWAWQVSTGWIFTQGPLGWGLAQLPGSLSPPCLDSQEVHCLFSQPEFTLFLSQCWGRSPCPGCRVSSHGGINAPWDALPSETKSGPHQLHQPSLL